MAIFMSLSKWGGDLLASFSIKTNKILYDFSLFYSIQIDSILLCICSAIYHRRHQNVVTTSVTHSAITSCHFFVLTTFSHHL